MTVRRPVIDLELEALRSHLIRTRLSGNVATTPANVIENCTKLIAGDVRYTFGLSHWMTATLEHVIEAVRVVCGGDPRDAGDPLGDGWIHPDATLRTIALHRDRLAAFRDAGGGRVLLATGHPTGLLAHYGAIARHLQQTGALVLSPLDDIVIRHHETSRDRRTVRFLDGVACVSDGGRLLHTHRSVYMEAMLDSLGGGPGAVDLVIADHGMAGAAIERGIPTLSIADVNDPALPLAQVMGRTDAVLPIDDNLPPSTFIPVTTAILSDGLVR